MLILIAIFICQAVHAADYLLVSGATDTSIANPIGLSVFHASTEGELTLHSMYTNVTTGNQPTYMALSSSHEYLYMTNEMDHGQIASFRVYHEGGHLSFLPLGIVPTHSHGPVHLVVTQDNRYVILASYNIGTVTVMEILPNGSVGQVVDQVAFTGGSHVIPGRQDSSHVHCVALSPCNCFVFVTDLGNDKIMQFRFDHTTGRLSPNTPSFIATGRGTLPRHLAFHPSGDRLYLTTEYSNEVILYTFHRVDGTLSEKRRVKASNASGILTAAIHITSSGLVMVSNRGIHDNSIVVFHDDLTFHGHFPTSSSSNGYPRDFFPFGSYLYAANKLTNELIIFYQQHSGSLERHGVIQHIHSPQCVLGLSIS